MECLVPEHVSREAPKVQGLGAQIFFGSRCRVGFSLLWRVFWKGTQLIGKGVRSKPSQARRHLLQQGLMNRVGRRGRIENVKIQDCSGMTCVMA